MKYRLLQTTKVLNGRGRDLNDNGRALPLQAGRASKKGRLPIPSGEEVEGCEGRNGGAANPVARRRYQSMCVADSANVVKPHETHNSCDSVVHDDQNRPSGANNNFYTRKGGK